MQSVISKDLPICSLKRGRKNAWGWKGGKGGEDLGGNEGGETLIRIYCMIKSFLNKKD